MADYTEQIDQLTGILLKEFGVQKATGKIDNNVSAYWSKVKKIFPDDLVKSIESSPEAEDTKSALESELAEQFKNQRFLAHTAMFVNQYEKKA